jgi:hypothetical protein
MRSRGLVAICVIAVLGALSSTAAAEPVFLTKSVVGEAVSSVPFAGTVGASYLEGKASKAKITCTGGSATGEVTGAQSATNIVLKLTGCETAGCKVHTEGLPEGEVESKVLAGKLGGVSSTKAGLKLFSQSLKGGTLLTAEVCGGVVKFVVTGEVTGLLSGASGESAATGKLLSSIKLTFAQSGGAQKYQGFSEGEEAGLMGQLTDIVNGTPELAGLSLIATNKTVPSTWELGVTK